MMLEPLDFPEEDTTVVQLVIPAETKVVVEF